jgi:SUMO ligase MMS21 Smc5/6 complex component
LQAVALATSEKRRRTSYLTCPISTGLLVNPLKARPCGHVYSKASAMAYFKGVGKKCAIFGCDKHLKWSDFVVDEASEGALREYYRRQARTRQDADGHPYGQLM